MPLPELPHERDDDNKDDEDDTVGTFFISLSTLSVVGEEQGDSSGFSEDRSLGLVILSSAT